IVALGGPQVFKLDWNTRALTPVDLNGDGLTDLAVLNNDRAQIDLLYQIKPGSPPPRLPPSVSINRWEPVVSDARFKKVSLTTGITMYDLAAGDLNGDGLPDLVYTGDPQALTVRYQQKNGDFIEKKIDDAPVPAQSVACLKIADLNRNGRADLVMLGQKELAVFYQNEKGELDAPVRYALSDEGCYGLDVLDVNGDGRPDLIYLSPSSNDPLRVRLQSSIGQFGPEQSYPIKSPRSTLQVMATAGKNRAAQFAYAQDQTGQLVIFELTATPDSTAGELPPVPRPRVFTPRAGSKAPFSYAFGDFDGDGREDIAVSDPEGAQIFIYFRQPDGNFTVAKHFPSLSEGRSIAAGNWDGSGRASLFVASSKEQVVGLATFTPEGRLTYPQPLPLSGKPLALAAADLTGKGRVQLVVACSDKEKYALEIWTRGSEGRPQLLKTIELPNQTTDPRAVRIFDANQDGKSDIAVFTPFEPMRLFVQGADFSFVEATPETGYRRGLVDNLDPSALSLADTNGDGKPEMLVGGTGFARALRLKPTGELAVIDQFNARDPSADIAAAFTLPAPRGQKPEIVLYDRVGQSFQFLRTDKHGVYQFVQTMPVGKIELVGLETRYDAKTGHSDVFLLGKDRFWWLPIGQPDFNLKTVATHTTDLPDISYSDVAAGDLNNDGRLDLVCIDPDKNLLEILSRDPAGVWQSRLHFKVFEKDTHYQGRRGSAEEPRETVIADVTGDGKADLILLVHDRVLVYPQE
ncbi:MAG: VCBS repeat-containing protein, partial [Verrucomicrobiota bacterium]|nr:VCBS repeat-containing protein [Verrucomicrobiota bacterium]